MQSRSRSSPAGKTKWPTRLLESLLLHLVVMAWLLHVAGVKVMPVKMPGRADGTRVLLTYSPGRAPAQIRKSLADPKVVKVKPPVHKLLPELPKPEPVTASNAPSPASAQPDAKTGNDGLGSGDINIALLSFFPVPKPDLTQLPPGTRGDVVIDVVIDATGKIVQLTMTKGLGHGVDESVLATVQQWTFHPATKDGRPVASEQELLFHYERS